MVNINEMYKTLPQRMAAARSALMRTTYGMGGVIKIEPDGDEIKYVLTATGESFKNVDRAFNAAASLHVTQVNPLLKPKLGNKVSGMAEIMQDIRGKASNFNAGQIQMLQNAGIDVNAIKDMEVDLLTMHADKGGVKGVASRIQTLRDRGTLHGITIMDDEGARMLNMRVGQKMLTSYQSNLLLSITGHDMLNPELFSAIMGKGTSPSESLIKQLMKVGKRFRSLASEREVSLAGDDLASFIGGKLKAEDFHKSMLVVDPQYELLQKMAHGSAYDFGGGKKGAELAAYYKNAEAEDFIGSIMSKLSTSEQDKLKDVIKSAKFSYDAKEKVGNKFASDRLMGHLEKNFVKGNANRRSIIKEMFDNIEYAYDGSDLINSKNIDGYIKKMQDRASTIRKQIDDAQKGIKPLTAERMEELAMELKDVSNIERQVSRAKNTGGLEQFTGRGHSAKYGDIKTAFQSVEFDDKLNKYSMIVSKMGFKGELGLAGESNILNLSGMGAGRDLVYADPVSTAFHPEIFADQETLEAMRRRSQTILQEFEGAISSGTVPRRVRAMLEQAAERDISHLPSYARGSAQRNREFAKTITDMINRGMSPNQNPTMMNMMHTFFATEAFREKGNFVQSVIPDTYRFAIDSEAVLMGTKKGKMLLNKGRGYEKISMSGLNLDAAQEAALASQDILKFRVSGHKMMLSADAIGQFRHALGGFDLDDKALPKLLTYEQQIADGKGGFRTVNRLGFNIFRQPSGPEELIFARMNMDQETIRGLFGGGDDVFAVKHFRNALDHLQSTTAPKDELHKTYTNLQNILDKTHLKLDKSGNVIKDKSGKAIEAELSPRYFEEYEQAIFNVFKKLEDDGVTKLQTMSPEMAAKIAQYGSSSLKTSELAFEPKYTREGVFKAFTKEGAFDMSEELLATMHANNVDQATINKLSRAKNFDEMLNLMQADYESNPAVRAAFASSIEELGIKKSIEGADILGLYVNRSMAVGATLNQYEAFLNDAGTSSAVKKYMLENYKIGLLSQETAIDLSVNLAGTKQLMTNVGDLLANLTASDASMYNEKGIQKALGELGLAGAGKKGMTLAGFGEQSMANLGKMIGFSRAVGSAQDDLQLGIDEFLLRERIKGSDTKIILDNMIQGMQDAQTAGHASQVDLDKTIKELQALSASNDEGKIKDELIKRIGLGSDNRFASMAASHEIGSSNKSYLDKIRRASISRMPADDILSSTSTSAEADSLARRIIATHKDSLEQIFSVTTDELKLMSEPEKFKHAAMLDSVGENVLRTIGQASQLENINALDLITAIDKQTLGAGSRIDVGGLRYLSSAFDGNMPQEVSQVAEMITSARDYRRIKFYESFDQDYANYIQSSLGNKNTMDEITEEAKRRLKLVDEAQKRIDNGSTDMVDAVLASNDQQDTLRALVGDSDQIADEMVRESSNHQATLIQHQMRRRDLEAAGFISPTGQDGILEKGGTIIDSQQAQAAFGDDYNLTDDIIRSVNDLDNGLVENKAVYKRIGEKMGDLKDLFKNPTIRRSTLALGALIAGSFAYTAIRDRTHEDMAGPPLLPGGSAYESGFPNRVPEIGTFGGPGYDSGVSYKVNLYGDQDTVRRFNAAAGGLVNGNINTTMYNRIPDVAQDPYTRMAANY
jgi:hypothetical protein